MKPGSNLSDVGIVISRLDFGEKDRIITVLTSKYGKLKVLARGVRSQKSKLAGGIELFAENHFVLIGGKSDLLILTSSRMEKYYGNIASDIDRSMFGYEALKNINKITPDGQGADYYSYLLELLVSLQDKKKDLNQIKIWFNLKLLNFIGVSPNLKTLKGGAKLPFGKNYFFDFERQCFEVSADGPYAQNHIKILRYFSVKQKMNPINKCPNKLVDTTEHLTNLLLKEHL